MPCETIVPPMDRRFSNPFGAKRFPPIMSVINFLQNRELAPAIFKCHLCHKELVAITGLIIYLRTPHCVTAACFCDQGLQQSAIRSFKNVIFISNRISLLSFALLRAFENSCIATKLQYYILDHLPIQVQWCFSI